MLGTRTIGMILLAACWLVTSSSVDNSTVYERAQDKTYTVTIQITGIRSSKGRIQFQIYLDQKSFKKETPWKETHLSKEKMKNKTIVYKLSGFKPGKFYGFALLDDENSDSKMNYGLFLPKEGYAFSDFFHTSLTKRPTFDDFKFQVSSDKTVSMVIRYL